MSKHDVIIIGSGIGGLTAALTCARAKRDVLVLEAGKQFGGYLNPFARRHFHFDPGVHYIGEAGPGGSFRRVLDNLGLDQVEFRELDPEGFDRYNFPGYEVRNCKGIERFRDRIAADVPEERDALHRFFELVLDFDRLGSLRLSGSARSRGSDIWKAALGAPGLARWSRATLKEMLDHYFKEPRAKAAIAGPVGDLGLPPSRLSALMHLGLLAHYAGGAYFPAGGSGPLRDAFVEALREEGATLERNARVESILHSGGAVTGVQLVDGRVFRAPTVISNTQATDTYAMAGLETLTPRFQKKVRATEHSIGSIVICAGVDGALDTSGVGSANIWSYDNLDIDVAFGERAMSDYRECGSFFLTVPTNKDPEGGLAPEGKQCVELVTLCGTEPFAKWFGGKTMRRGEEYAQLKDEIAAFYLERAEKHLPRAPRSHRVLRSRYAGHEPVLHALPRRQHLRPRPHAGAGYSFPLRHQGAHRRTLALRRVRHQRRRCVLRGERPERREDGASIAGALVVWSRHPEALPAGHGRAQGRGAGASFFED